ncbi:MAG TPA: YgcG family protein [Burkholderiales bacterium]|nr:YgcG family protein [Burkholderiales bacterium]
MTDSPSPFEMRPYSSYHIIPLAMLGLRRLGWLFSLTLLFIFSSALFAQQPIPPLKSRITDLTNTLTPAQTQELEAHLASFEARKGSQIAVLIVPTTEPEVIEEYGIRLADAWQIGRKGVGDGAILLIAKNDRRMRIEVGRGLEGVIPDAIAKRIIAEGIAPRFRQGDFYGGVRTAVDQMMKVIDNEPLPPPKAKSTSSSGGDFGSFIPIAFMLVLVVGGILRAMLGRFFGAIATGGVMAAAGWFFVGLLAVSILAGVIGFILTLVMGGMGRGGLRHMGGLGHGGWGGGGGGFGGGGGNWSGGGGDFGGGGASGDW